MVTSMGWGCLALAIANGVVCFSGQQITCVSPRFAFGLENVPLCKQHSAALPLPAPYFPTKPLKK